MRQEPGRQLGSDALDERLVEQLIARQPQPAGKRLVGVHDPPPPIGDHHHVRDRIERVFQLSPRPQHIVEQLHVLDGVRELTAELVGPIEKVELAARLHAHAVEDDRPERPAAASERHRHGARLRIVRTRHDFRPRPAHGDRCRRERVVRIDLNAAGQLLRIGRRARARGDARDGRAPRRTCGPLRPGGWSHDRKCRGRSRGSTSPRCSWRTHPADRADRAEAAPAGGAGTARARRGRRPRSPSPLPGSRMPGADV